jgi:hypothetical protein
MGSMLRRTGTAFRLGRSLRCSFCSRSENEVLRLVAGASGYICDACTAACVVILQNNGGFELPPDRVR